ncbi:EAL domain-containing protein [Acidithiobacillus sp. MC6.1]|nr:EAL domain-containing protein [Acidithiobacillus sp. MC6.1]
MATTDCDDPVFDSPRWQAAMQAFGEHVATDFVATFYAHLEQHPETKKFIDLLTTEEFTHLKHQQQEHLRNMLDPQMDADGLLPPARNVGRVHALIGMTASDLSRAYRLQLELITNGVNKFFPSQKEDRDHVRLVFLNRLLEDMDNQMAGMQEIAAMHMDAQGEIERAAHTSANSSDFMRRILGFLSTLPKMCLVAMTRPNGKGILQVEDMASATDREDAMVEDKTCWIIPRSCVHASEPCGQGTDGVSWRTGQIVVVDSCLLNQNMTEDWHKFIESARIRSLACIPLLDHHGHPWALLELFHGMPGYFSSSERKSFLQHLQSLLSQSLTSTMQTSITPYPQRIQYREMLEGDHVEMYYQPLVNLATGTVHKVEALARLQDADGRLIPPKDFLGAFGEHELLVLFDKGLHQALEVRRQWEREGVSVSISINLPTEGMGNPDYLQAIHSALVETQTPPDVLTLELLETEDRSIQELGQWLGSIKGLGVRLAQDDLGSGYSSLLRMNSRVFDEVKIDQGLVRQTILNEPKRALSFIGHISRLGHDMGLKVTVEGLESLALIEASAFLGAANGQGYGIARPMAAADLVGWIRNYRVDLRPGEPRTALGALAAHMLWHMQLQSVGPWPELVEHFLRMPCAMGFYIRNQGLQGTLLDQSHEHLHALALQGPLSPMYDHGRRRMEALLMELVQKEASLAIE